MLFQVRAQIQHCNQFAGYRKLVYSHAEMHGAICNGDLGNSIFYADNNIDLNIVLNFEHRSSAMRLIGDLLNMRTRHQGRPEDFHVKRLAIEVLVAEPLSYVFAADYERKDISPPASTVSVTEFHGEMDKRLQVY